MNRARVVVRMISSRNNLEIIASEGEQGLFRGSEITKSLEISNLWAVSLSVHDVRVRHCVHSYTYASVNPFHPSDEPAFSRVCVAVFRKVVRGTIADLVVRSGWTTLRHLFWSRQ